MSVILICTLGGVNVAAKANGERLEVREVLVIWKSVAVMAPIMGEIRALSGSMVNQESHWVSLGVSGHG